MHPRTRHISIFQRRPARGLFIALSLHDDLQNASHVCELIRLLNDDPHLTQRHQQLAGPHRVSERPPPSLKSDFA
jgi:hypothetical protein